MVAIVCNIGIIRQIRLLLYCFYINREWSNINRGKIQSYSKKKKKQRIAKIQIREKFVFSTKSTVFTVKVAVILD